MNVMHKLSGGCHCGNIVVTVELTAPLDTYHPRACDCDFCQKHAAAYISDPNGSLVIQTKNAGASTYRQGSGQAEMLLCGTRGVLIGALYRSEQRLYAALNSRALGAATHFGSAQCTSPQKLSPGDKVRRWQEL